MWVGKLKILEIPQKISSYFLGNEVSKKIATNSSWLIGNTIFSMVIGVFITAIVARYFGAEKYGQFNYALSFTALFSTFSTLGLPMLTVKAIVDKEYEEGTILFTSMVIRSIGGLLLTIVGFIIIRLLEPNDKVVQILVLIMSITMIIKALAAIEYWMEAHQKAKVSSIIRMALYIVTVLLKLVVVFTGGNLYHYAMVYLIDAVIVGTALVFAYFRIREDISPWRFDFKYAKEILLKSWYLIISGLMGTLYMRIDQVMLGHMMSNKTELGVYSAAVAVSGMWYFVPLAVIGSFKPVIMQRKKTDEVSYLKTMQMLYCLIAWMSILFSVGILLFSKLIIAILYGPEFSEAASILSISIWAGTFAVLGSARSVWLITEGLQRYTMVYTVFGFIVNLVLNLILIPKIGAYGAAVATLVAQFMANIVALYFFKETRISTLMIIKSFSPRKTYELLKDIFK